MMSWPPPAPTSFAPTPTCARCCRSSRGATAYSWDFGDGNNSVAADPGNTYANAGTYTVGLTATGTGGTNMLFRTNYILVLGPPQLVINPGTLDFGMVFTNTTAQASFVISNAGGALLVFGL